MNTHKHKIKDFFFFYEIPAFYYGLETNNYMHKQYTNMKSKDPSFFTKLSYNFFFKKNYTQTYAQRYAVHDSNHICQNIIHT